MDSHCPKCGRNVPDDAVYCPYCAQGLKPLALTGKVSAAGVLMLIACSGFFIVFVISLSALVQIYSWYPPLTAQKWFAYDEVFTGFCLSGFLTNTLSSTLIFARRLYRPTVTLVAVSALLGGCVWLTSMIIPEFKLMYSILYYFLPMFLCPLIAALLILSRKPEFQQRSGRQKVDDQEKSALQS
jgi:hypothetical protein